MGLHKLDVNRGLGKPLQNGMNVYNGRGLKSEVERKRTAAKQYFFILIKCSNTCTSLLLCPVFIVLNINE
jgi:hypothetical protein